MAIEEGNVARQKDRWKRRLKMVIEESDVARQEDGWKRRSKGAWQ
jgi:hypothetical protein